MNKRILMVRKIFSAINGFLLMNLLMFWFVYAMLQMTVKPVYFAFLIWLAVANFFVKEISENSILPLIYNVVMSGIVYYSLHIWGVRIMFWVFIAWMLVEDVSQITKGFTKQADIEVRWGGFVLTLVVFLFGVNIGNQTLRGVSFITLIVMLLVFFIEKYFDGLYLYLEQSRSFKGVPLKNALEVNSVMVAVVIAVLLFGIFVGTILPLDKLISLIWGVVWKGITFVFGIMMFIGKWFATLFSGGTVSEIDSPMVGTGDPEPIPKLAGDAAEKFLQLVVTLVLTWAFARLAVSVAKKLVLKNRETPEHVEISVIKSVQKEKIRQSKNKYKDRSPRGRARALYKSTVLSKLDCDAIKKSDTCKDIVAMLDDDISEISKIYEDIRYGEAEVSREMLEKMHHK